MPKMTDQVEVTEHVEATDHIEAAVKRGPESWNYIYITLGFALTIEATIISMIEILRFPCNILLFAVLFVGTVSLFLYNGSFQNKLLGFKSSYESKFR